MKKRTKPEPVGTVWVLNARICRIEVVDGKPQWKVLATCLDTPNAIAACVARLSLTGGYWVLDAFGGKKYVSR